MGRSRMPGVDDESIVFAGQMKGLVPPEGPSRLRLQALATRLSTNYKREGEKDKAVYSCPVLTEVYLLFPGAPYHHQ